MNTEAKRMSIKDGGPFHPCEVRLTDAGELLGVQTGNAQGIHTGASLRDHFAGLAMAAMLGPNHPYGGRPEGLIPAGAYRMADAMLRAREIGQ